MFLHTPFLSLLTIVSLAAAQSSSNNASAVFVYGGYEGTQLVFALNADKSTGDLYFHLESPAGNAWVGVGIGSQMKGALMFIAYPGNDGKTVTISPRIADGHSEPSCIRDISTGPQIGPGLEGANTIAGSGRNKKIVADAVCRACAKGKYGQVLDLSNKTQPFIFAVGPVFPAIHSDSLSAGLTRHEFYGHFTMDMTAATSPRGGSVPVGPYTNKDASQAEGTEIDHYPGPRMHGLFMGLVFILLLPLSSLLLRVWNKVKGHMIVNYIAIVLFCLAFAGGCVISQLYNKSKHFASAHQIIGIFILLALFAQLALGVVHHRIFVREQRKTIMGKIHMGLGPAIIVFGIINGALGFSFAGMSNGHLIVRLTLTKISLL